MNDAVMSMRRWESIQRQVFEARVLTTNHAKMEQAHNTQLRSENAGTRNALRAAAVSKMWNDDQSYDEITRNNKLEPMNVLLSSMATTQDHFINQMHFDSNALERHNVKRLEHNNVLLAEKKALKLSIQANEREELWNHENAVAVDVQRPTETKTENYYEARTNRLNQFVHDMKERNAMLAATVPGLTTDRDSQERAKLNEEMQKVDMELQTDGLEVGVRQLQKSVAALEKLRMQYQMANSDLTFYNTKLSAEIDTLIAERDVLRTNYEEMVNQRNAAQLVADHHEVLWTEMKQDVLSAHKRATLSAQRRIWQVEQGRFVMLAMQF